MNREQQQLQEGFYTNQTIIQETITYSHSFQIRPTDNNPRVFKHQPILTKLPIEILESFTSLNSPSQQFLENQVYYNECSKTIERQESQTPFQKYEMDSDTYKLVYSKTDKTPFHSSMQNFANRQIKLNSSVRYEQHNFSVLKNCQLNQHNANIKPNNKLEFNSKFECGNLLCVYQQVKTAHNYHCFIQNDTNTKGYNQWFYFAISEAKKDTVYRFHILNFKKRFSFFKVGMKPVVFSLKRHQQTGNGWMRKGEHLTYRTSSVYDLQKGKQIKLYSLYFEISFEFDNDFITISSGIPYSYSRLTHHLKRCEQIAKASEILWEQRTIAYSLSNNQIPYISISKPIQPIKEQCKVKKGKKRLMSSNDDESQPKIIILLARQHPGESQSSFLMQQLLYWLAKNDSEQVKWILSRYEFRIFPMVNVDGVIYGNFRTDLAGYDLNRVWKSPIKQLHPQICAIKSQIERLNRSARIVGCFDLHSHSKQYNIFSYCCKQDEIESRLLSYLFSKTNPFFHFPFCTFGISKQKQSTARASIFSMINNPNVITIQCSAYAANNQEKVILLEPKQLKLMAWSMIISLKSYYSHDQLALQSLSDITNNLAELISLSKRNWQEVSGSDSDPEGDEVDSESKLKRILPSSVLRTIEKNMKSGSSLSSKSDEQNLRKTIEKDESAQKDVNAGQQLKYSGSRKIMNKYQKIKREFKKRQLKRSIITPCELQKYPQIIQNQVEHQIIIELPMEKWKDNNNWSGTYKIKTEPKREPMSNFHMQQYGPNEKTISKSGLIISRPYKHSMKQLSGGLVNKKSGELQQKQHISPDQHIRIGPKKDEKLELKQSMLKKLSKLSKVIVVRKRTNTIKNINKEVTNLSEDECALLHIRSANKNIVGNNEGCSEFKNNTKHLTELINKKKQSSPKNQEKEYSKAKTETKTRRKNTVNASLLSQVWRVNYGKYSKDLQ